MNVEGDFRYVNQGAFEECIDFLEYLNEHDGNWEEAFVGWINVSERRKEERRMPQNNWDPWKLVKVLNCLLIFFFIPRNLKFFVTCLILLERLSPVKSMEEFFFTNAKHMQYTRVLILMLHE